MRIKKKKKRRKGSYLHFQADSERPLFLTREALHKSIKLKIKKDEENLASSMIWLLTKIYFPKALVSHLRRILLIKMDLVPQVPTKNYVSWSLCLLVNQEQSFWIYLLSKWLESKIKTFTISVILQVNFFMCFFWLSENRVFFSLGGGKRRFRNCVLKPKTLFAVNIANVCLKQICENLQFVVGVEFCYFSQWRNCSL